jgi:hypothetical protein
MLAAASAAGWVVLGSCASAQNVQGVQSAQVQVAEVKRARADEVEWLEKCPPESREAVTSIPLTKVLDARFAFKDPVFLEEEGGNVIRHEAGVEIREGPIVAGTNIPYPARAVVFHGHARTGVDGVSLRFTRLVFPEDGREFAICALGGAWGDWPGLNIARKHHPDAVPESKLHSDAGYVYVTTDLLELRIASKVWP